MATTTNIQHVTPLAICRELRGECAYQAGAQFLSAYHLVAPDGRILATTRFRVMAPSALEDAKAIARGRDWNLEPVATFEAAERLAARVREMNPRKNHKRN